MAIVEQDIVFTTKDATGNTVIQMPITRAENIENVMSIEQGGTGSETASGARTNLGLATAVTGASINGKVITLNKADGTKTTLTTQDTNTGSDMTDYIIEGYRDGTEWYRVWKSGWIEQGGRTTTSGTNVSVTFPKAFSSTVCSVVATKNRSAAKENPASVNNVSTTGMTICSSNDAAYYYWFACGY